MAKVVDCTERDTVKHTKLTSGTVVKTKWKLSSCRINKETLLNSDVVKNKDNKGRSLRTQSTTSTRRNKTVSDSDEVLPLAYKSSVIAHPSKDEDGCHHVKELQHKLIKLEESVASMESELTSMKTVVFNEFQELKRTLLQGHTDSTNQFQALLEAIIQSHSTARETQKLMKASRVAAEERSHEEQRTLPANDNSKRIQPMYGKIENGLVTCHKNGRKIFAIDREIYRQMFDDSKTGTSFLRKLLKVTFTEEELSGSNFSGGIVTSATGMTVKKCLDRDRVLALLGQVELEFPNSTKFGNFTKMREAINEECRRVVRQIRQDQAL